MDDVRRSAESSPLEPPLYGRIVRVIAAEIAQGEIAAGERLLESRLASRFGLSRAPARQALAELKAHGLVTPATAPSRGFVVVEGATARADALVNGVVEPQSFETVPIWQRIYGEVEDAITKRIAFASWRVLETALGQHFGVSRTVAREVLARLQSRGLVLNEGKRWIAQEMSPERVRDLYAVRAILEPAALESAAPAASKGRIGEMISDLTDAIETKATGAPLDALERDLHVDLLGHTTNVILRRAMEQHQSLLLAHRYFYRLTAQMYEVEPFLAEHLAVLKPLFAGRIGTAKRALHAHLMASSDRAVDRIAMIRGRVPEETVSFLEPLPPASR
ncbi:MAG: GntR family transcriptional regulator [Pseudomonadota bacterium]